MADISVNSQSIDFVSTGVINMLDAMMMQNMVKERDIHKVIVKVESSVRLAVRKALLASLSQGRLYTKTKSAHHHYRHVENAVKMSIYKKILGANVSLYSKKNRKSASTEMPYQGRYNPRRERSKHTIQMQSYTGDDAWMIDMWINNGTSERKTGYRQHYNKGMRTSETRSGHWSDRRKSWVNNSSHSTGRIGGTNFFDVAPGAQRNAADDLAIRLNKILLEINKEFENA